MDGILIEAYRIPGVKQVVLSVVDVNGAAIALYERTGFREYGRIERHFEDGTVSTAQFFMAHEGAPGR